MVKKNGQGIKDGGLSRIIFPDKRSELIYLNSMLVFVATEILENNFLEKHYSPPILVTAWSYHMSSLGSSSRTLLGILSATETMTA